MSATPRVLLASVLLAAAPSCGTAHTAATPEPAKAEPAAAPAPPAPYLLLEYVPSATHDGLAVARELAAADPRRAELDAVFRRPLVRWLLALGAEAQEIARRHCTESTAACAARHDHPALFVVMDGGNRPKQGIAIDTGSGARAYPHAWYVEIDAEGADLLVPHEYGHTLMFELLPGDVPYHPGTLPHTTGAITNDVTAFSEGWGIHFETLAADRRETTGVYEQRHRDAFATAADGGTGDSVLPAKDLLSYAQSYRRYTCIKEGCFAFLPRLHERFLAAGAPTAADVLAHWTDTTHDPARLRSLAQMVASEGVVAALFYRLATAPEPGGPDGEPGDPPLPDPARYRAFFEAFATLTESELGGAPALLVFLHALLDAAPPAERRRIAAIALEVLHYTPVFDDARAFYADLHDAGHAVDPQRFRSLVADRTPAMKDAIDALAADPSRILQRAVHELWIENDALTLSLPILGMHDRPLVFDLQTATVELLMTLPGVGLDEARAFVAARDRRGGFADIDEVTKAPGMTAAAAAVREMRAHYLAGAENRSAE